MTGKNIIFTESPSALYTLWNAFRTRKTRYLPAMEYPVIHVLRPGFAIDETHLRKFQRICGLSPSDSMPMLYPFTLAYPYIMRVLATKEMPVSLFKILNTRNSITMHRPVTSDARLDIDCCNHTPRPVAKGLELDIESVVSSGGERICDNVTTYFFPGEFGTVDNSYEAPRLDTIEDAPVIKEWYLPAKDRFRFARISGDTNGIHYGSSYARMMGFKRDFAQPLRVVSQCVSALPAIKSSGPVRLDFYLRGPAYYESTLTLKNIQRNKGSRFDLYCSGNARPVICRILQTL